MKNQKGVTLVALVVTIIVLIILAGISINLLLGDNGIITIAKKAKENTELAKVEEETELNELYAKLENNGGSSGEISYDAIAKLKEFKTAIANAIEEAGGKKPDISSETAVFANNIKGIVKEVTKSATATAEDIAEGKTAWVNGKEITGTGKTNSGSTPDQQFYAYHWNGDGSNYTAQGMYDVSSYNKVKITITKDQPDGTITISSNTTNRTLLSTNCSNLSSEYTFDVSDDTQIKILRVYTYGSVALKLTKVE